MSARTPPGDCAVSPPARLTLNASASLSKPFKKLVDPGLGQVLRQGERQECSDRGAAHGSDVAETAGEAAMAHGLGWMPLAAEVHPFEAEIGSDQRFVTGGNFEDGAVVSDASGYASPPGSSTPDARDQRSFRERQDSPTI